MPSERVTNLRARIEELNDSQSAVRAAVEADGRDMTQDERVAYRESNDLLSDLADELIEVERDEAIQARLSERTGRRSEPERPRVAAMNGHRRNGNGEESRRGMVTPKDGTHGFEGLGQFLMAVRRSTVQPQNMDPRFTIRADTATEYSSSDPGAEGGFVIPPDFRNMIAEKVFGESTLLGRCDVMQTSGNQITIPIDENEPWAVNGLQVRWEGEGSAKLTSVVDLDQQTVRANKIAGVVPVTDELLEDASALQGYIFRKVPEKINFKTSLAIVQGSGTGEPLGILQSTARITVDAGAAPVGSIQYPHITNMYSRMPAESRGNAVWLVNPEVEPALMTMAFMPAASATLPPSPVPVYLPPSGLSTSPYGTLMGRPVIPTQVCNALGVEGDIIFVDLKQYLAVTKGGSIRTETSIHVYFLQDITAFRFVLRIGGKPWWKRPIQPRTGTFTMSPYVTLEAR
jgi:HK97 family phage major capsid protein